MANGNNNGMRTQLRLDPAGRIVLPQAVREHFHLERGAVLELEVEQDTIILRPRVHEATLVEEKGLLVHEGEPSSDLLSALDTARRNRDRDIAATLK